MKKLIVISFLIVLPIFNSLCQSIYEDGYFIDESGKKITCYIKNFGSLDVPNEIKYRDNPTSQINKIETKTLSEFQFGINKYKKFILEIDQSSEDAAFLSKKRKPEFLTDTVFVKYIVEGDANLFFYKKNDNERFFFSLNDEIPTQLIKKSYLVDGEGAYQNNEFRQQIWNSLKCACISSTAIEKAEYKSKDLSRLFVKYNESQGNENVNYLAGKNSHHFEFKINAGLRQSFLKTGPFRLKSLITPIIALEIEYFFPSKKKKWSTVFKPSFNRYQYNERLNTSDISVNYQSIILSTGIRYYAQLFGKFKAFGTLYYSPEIFLEDHLSISNRAIGSSLQGSSINLSYGIGLNYNKKISIEFEYGNLGQGFQDNTKVRYDYPYRTVIVGYRLYRTK